jgi:predicted RNA-binding protein YlqC (UPF0109 family)
MAGISDILKNYVENTTKMIVDAPGEVNVAISVSTKAVIIQIKVAAQDCGKIIGKKGRTIESLKTLCLAIKNTQFSQDQRTIFLEVLEDENSQHRFNKKTEE